MCIRDRYISPLARQIFRDCAAKARIGDEMGGVGGVRQVAARELMLSLRAGFDPFQLMHNRVIDRLIIAELEMQERMMLERTPVAAIDCIRTERIDRPGDA